MMQVQLMPTVGEILTLLTTRKNISDNDLADATGLNQPTISRIKSGESKDPRDRTLRPLAEYFGVTVSQLRGDLPLPEYPPLREPSNVSPGPPIRGMVPLISWVSAGRWREPDVSLEPPLEWVPFVGTNPHTFALRVQGDSMEPEYPQGHVIVVDPEMPAEPMDLVVAMNGDGEATFKRLTKEGSTWYLMPLNPRYPPHTIDSLCQIIGVVVWSGKKEKCLR
ncbi:MAG: S24 family peptidase [Candidatus Competibacter denitrificans]